MSVERVPLILLAAESSWGPGTSNGSVLGMREVFCQYNMKAVSTTKGCSVHSTDSVLLLIQQWETKGNRRSSLARRHSQSQAGGRRRMQADSRNVGPPNAEVQAWVAALESLLAIHYTNCIHSCWALVWLVLWPTWHGSLGCLMLQTADCTHHTCMVSPRRDASDCGKPAGISGQNLCRIVHICMASLLERK